MVIMKMCKLKKKNLKLLPEIEFSTFFGMKFILQFSGTDNQFIILLSGTIN